MSISHCPPFAAVALAVIAAASANAQPALLTTGLQGTQGSTIGPDGALYLTEGALGRISRVAPGTGEVTTFASGLPPSVIGTGGAFDVAFLGETAYALVTLVGPDLNDIFGPGTVAGDGDVVGIYRIDGPDSHTVIADIGAFNLAHPPSGFSYFIPTGVQYAIETFRGGFLVTDGHLNRVLRITRDGTIDVFMAFGNVVPTGLTTWGNTVYLSQAGPVPHLAEEGRVVAFGPTSAGATEVASGGALLVDVERGRGARLYALAQGIWDGAFEGSPAIPDTGQLLEVNADGTFTVLAAGLDRPTSMQCIGTTAYIVTLTGEVWMIADAVGPPFGR